MRRGGGGAGLQPGRAGGGRGGRGGRRVGGGGRGSRGAGDPEVVRIAGGDLPGGGDSEPDSEGSDGSRVSEDPNYGYQQLLQFQMFERYTKPMIANLLLRLRRTQAALLSIGGIFAFCLTVLIGWTLNLKVPFEAFLAVCLLMLIVWARNLKKVFVHDFS